MSKLEGLSAELRMANYYVVALRPSHAGADSVDVVQPCNYYRYRTFQGGGGLLEQIPPIEPTQTVPLATVLEMSNYVCLQQLKQLKPFHVDVQPPLDEKLIDTNVTLFSATLKTVDSSGGAGPFQNTYLASTAGPNNNPTLILDASRGRTRGGILTFALDQPHKTPTGLVIGLRATFDPEIKGTI